MKYCSQCGHELGQLIPPGDNRLRYVCGQCNAIHYQNPRIITGCLPVHEDRVLLCKRSIEPRAGYWTLPAGFLENSETVSQGALREMEEEANARGEDPQLYTMFSLPHISQVYMFFMTRLADLDFSAGEESSEVRLFSQAEIPWDQLAFPVIQQTLEFTEIPWDQLAFPVIQQTLEFYFEDYPGEDYPVRVRDILYRPRRG